MESTPGRKTAVSIGLYLALSFISFFHCLVLGKAYFANDLIQFYASARFFLKSQLAMGHFPLWNPYLMGGQPFFADPNSMMGYPLLYPTLLFPIAYGLGVFYFLHIFLAACGMHYWLRSLRLSENASRVGALLFCLSGFFWWEVIHPPILAAVAWFPWWMGGLENLSRDRSPRRAFMAGLFFAFLFVCGNFQMTSYFLYVGLFYFAFRLFVPAAENSPAPARALSWRQAALILLFGLWGGLYLMVHLVPAYEFSKYSNRRSPDQTYDNFNGQFSMHPLDIYEFLFPSFGVPPGETLEMDVQQVTDSKNIDNAFYGVFGYIGIWFPFLAFLAFRRKEKKPVYLALAIGLLCVLTAWGRYFPLHQILCTILPAINLSRVPFRILAAYVGFASLLAAYGYQTFEKAVEEKRDVRSWALGGLVYAALLFVIGCLQPQLNFRELLALAFGAAGLALWGMTESWKKMGKWLFWAALVIPLLISGWSDFGWGPASNLDFEKNFPAFTALKENAKGGRYYFDQSLPYAVQVGNTDYRWGFPQNAPMEFGIRDSGGYNPIYLLKPMALKSLPLPTYIKVMAIRAFLLGKDQGEMKGFNHQVMGDVHYYGVDSPVDFVTAPSQWKVIPDDQELVADMKSPDFDPANQVFFSEAPPASLTTPLTGQKAALQYDWVSDDPNEQSFHLRLDRDSWVVFSEVMFPGWKALVDGKPSQIFTGNDAFRTLLIPAGDHQVSFQYQPAWSQPLLIGFILWLLSALGYALYAWRSRPNPAKTGANG
jgi:hypothetical protein